MALRLHKPRSTVTIKWLSRVAITESKVPPSPKYLPISTFAEKVSQSLNWQGLVQTHLQNGTLSPKKNPLRPSRREGCARQ